MWKYCEICCVSITIYIKEKKSKTQKKIVATEVIVPLGTVATIQILKKKNKDKVAHQNCTIDEQWKTLYESDKWL